ncbi:MULTISPECIES: methyltransferase domain-containing protein [unclassified Acinetobacter]|uniref:methyltransferase domain-containing protein n=1 Tax=unclassified Acinetobacter TaxID=196816 RepID=UPI00211DECD7|nr:MULTISPECIES: methyltransferase domain-containing protein [unclassified Acinetobacter]
MNQHWDNLYSQTQDLYGISPNHFIQQIADQIPIVGKTLAIAEGEGRNILYLANKAKQQNDSFSAEIWDYSKVAMQHLSTKAQQAGFEFTLRNIDLNDVEWPRECYQNVMCVYGHFDENTQFNVLTGIRQALTNNGLLESFILKSRLIIKPVVRKILTICTIQCRFFQYLKMIIFIIFMWENKNVMKASYITENVM